MLAMQHFLFKIKMHHYNSTKEVTAGSVRSDNYALDDIPCLLCLSLLLEHLLFCEKTKGAH